MEKIINFCGFLLKIKYIIYWRTSTATDDTCITDRLMIFVKIASFGDLLQTLMTHIQYPQKDYSCKNSIYLGSSTAIDDTHTIPTEG